MSEINNYNIIDEINENLNLLILSIKLNDISEFNKIISYFDSLEESDIVKKEQLSFSISQIMRMFTILDNEVSKDFIREALSIVSTKTFLQTIEMNISRLVLNLNLESINKTFFKTELDKIISDENEKIQVRRNALTYYMAFAEINETNLKVYKDLLDGVLYE